MKRPLFIIASITGTAAAIAIGYFGSHYFGRNTMLVFSGGMLSIGSITNLTQFKQSPQKGLKHPQAGQLSK